MDIVYYNGKISTLDDADTFYEAVGVANGKVAFLGTSDEAMLLDAETRVNLNGRLLLPGFVDSHLHMLHYAFV